jgi:predicted aspartyl protease
VSQIQSLHENQAGAASRIAATAADARRLGFENVETHYEPQTGHHTVTGDLPAATAQRKIDRILGR